MNYTEKINVLIEALPYVNRFRKHIIVIKYGGNAMINSDLRHSVMQDILMMKSVGMIPIVVHGGGPFISQMLDNLSIESHFVDGLRSTSEEAMKVAEMVLSGSVNNDIVRTFNHLGGNAIGLSGLDDHLITVTKKKVIDPDSETQVDLGYVGNVESVNTLLLTNLIQADYVPIISSVGIGSDGHSYNINADEVASAVAIALGASKLIFLTNTPGLLADSQDPDSLISKLSIDEANQLIENKVITEGMIPKINCCLEAITNGVDKVHIIDGRMSHSLLLELFFDMGIGTMLAHSNNDNKEV